MFKEINRTEQSNKQEQTVWSRFDKAAGHPFPSPRAWPAVLGAADMPIGCALNFLGTSPIRKEKGRARCPAFGSEI
jgi:hypothetical protein